MLRLLLDENLNHRILRGLKLRLPDLDYILAQDAGLKGLPDTEVLAWAAEHQRILVTHDLKTIPRYAYARIVVGEQLPGVIAISKSFIFEVNCSAVNPSIRQLHFWVKRK
ncbi:MAG: hypothetical protein QOC96_2738 [Acidobacteriota bacterium]|jgi:predicted nuclease of predicted toxin-antitoxin system|nr:hypothetical protein [Acidobacteriota bacterium]